MSLVLLVTDPRPLLRLKPRQLEMDGTTTGRVKPYLLGIIKPEEFD
jgi:hypothetical protein